MFRGPGSPKSTMGRSARRIVDDSMNMAVHILARHIRRPEPQVEGMEREVSALRRELDETRVALRLQTARCRQLVAAFSARLRDRDERLRAGNALRDHQLALVLRALLALEARLRREQKAIRAQLAQRDAVIQQQQLEISHLRGRPDQRTRHPAPAAPAATPAELILVNHTCGQGSQCHDEPPSPPGKPAKRRSKPKEHVEKKSEDKYLRPRLPTELHETFVDPSNLKHQEATLRVLELVDPSREGPGTPIPLLNGETASIVEAGLTCIEPPADFIEDVMTPPPDVVASYNEMNRECLELASMAASLRGETRDTHKKSKEDPPEARTALLKKSPRSARNEYQDNPVLECVNLILLRDQEDFQEERRRVDDSPPHSLGPQDPREPQEPQEPQAWYNTKEKTPPPQRAQVLQEKECLRLSSQRLTVARNLDFENVDVNGNTATQTGFAERKAIKSATPPALPPKPARLSAARMSPPKSKKPPPPPARATVITAKEGQLDTTSPATLGAPKIISNGSGAFNLVKDSRPEVSPRSVDRSVEPAARPVVNGHGSAKENGESQQEFPKSKASSVRVCISVTSESAVGDPSRSVAGSPEDEDGNDALRRNFEEFKLDECDIEGLGEDLLNEGRPDGDGAEARNGLHQDILTLTAPVDAALASLVVKDVSGDVTTPASYDNFLEATGLSTKSILTPSRMLSNHRSVLKPKDVKHRSRVKAERCLTTTAGGPTVKYWTEPFL